MVGTVIDEEDAAIEEERQRDDEERAKEIKRAELRERLKSSGGGKVSIVFTFLYIFFFKLAVASSRREGRALW